MLYVNPAEIPAGIELVSPFSPRRITHAFHDIDGTHSLIRDWVPVMTLVTGFVADYGLPDVDSPAEMAAIMACHSPAEFPEGKRFAIESAGLSALTQMEWALRCAACNGHWTLPGGSSAVNAEIIERIWHGDEEFDPGLEPAKVRELLKQEGSRLFRAYEILLLAMGRDRNLEAARRDPEKWRVPGSLEFLTYLKDHGVRNYFVTGAVIEYDESGYACGTMAEEIKALGLEARPGGAVEKLVGSTWHEKLPKDKLMLNICNDEQIKPENVLVVGDGRSEIAAAVAMNAVAMSRLNRDAVRAREIHRELGTNLIVERYNLDEIRTFMTV